MVEKARRYLHFVSFEDGERILRLGDYSDSAYFVVSGVAVVERTEASMFPLATVRQGASGKPAIEPSDKTEMIGRGTGGTMILGGIPSAGSLEATPILRSGELFGELSALSRYPVSSDVRASGATTLLQIRLPGLRMLMAASKEFKKFLDERYRARTLATHLRGVSLFSSLDDRLIEQLRAKAELKSYEPGQRIVEEGSVADRLLLVRGGYVKVGVKAGGTDLAVTYLRAGDFAGEASLLLEQPWPFSLQALENVEIVEIPKTQFEETVAASAEVSAELWRSLVERLKARGAALREPASSASIQMAMDTGLIHGESVLLIDLNTCTRCDECVRGCADAHGGEARFIREGAKYRNWLIPTACYQCTDPVCMIDCPTGAISRTIGTLEVTIDEATCIGCTNCAKRCPWDNIIMVDRPSDPNTGKHVEVASKCDLCQTRPEGPACVQMCPHGSAVRISFKDLETVRKTLE